MAGKPRPAAEVLVPFNPDESIEGRRPNVDSIYDRLSLQVLQGLAAGEDDRLATAVTRKFREGTAQLCCRSIGAWLEQRLADRRWTQRELAERIGVDRSAVARWTAGGTISLSHLVLVLLEFQCDFNDLPLPMRQELAIEGYLAALDHVRTTLGPDQPVVAIDRERFWCLYHLLSEPYWERAIRARDRALIHNEVRRVHARIKESLGRPPRVIRSIEEVRRTVDGWAIAWIVTLHLLPGGWPIR